MIREQLNSIIESVSQKYSVEEITKSKEEFLGINGAIFEDDKSYDARMGSFLEWFVLEKGNQLREISVEINQLTPEEREIYANLEQGIHSLFLLKKIRSQSVVVLELFGDKKYEVQEEDGKFYFNKGDVFEGRLFSHQKQYYFTDNFCHHPKETADYIFSKVKVIRGQEAENFKTLKQMTKERDALKKKIDGLNRNIESLQIKREKAANDSKKEKLQAKINPLNSEKTQLEVEFYEKDNRIADFEENEIRVGQRSRRLDLIRRLSYMSLKWERYHNVDIRDIYKD